MKLQEIFDQLTYGELSQLAIGGGEEGKIDDVNYEKILAHINLGLTDLYKRFNLKEGRLIVQLQAGRLTYPINSNFAVSNRRSREPVKFILDSVIEPFENDIHKIERVYTEDGYELDINNRSNEYSLSTPSAYVLRVPTKIVESSSSLPDCLKTLTLEVAYRANHPVVSKGIGFYDPDRVDLELPYTHLEPLLLFVASRVNNPIGMTNEFHAGNSYAAKYEQACARLENDGYEVDQGSQSTRLRAKGWV